MPRLEIRGVETLFLLDTGADVTSVHPGFGRGRVRIPYHRLYGRTTLNGVGGGSQYFTERAFVAFSDDALVRFYEIDLFIAQPSAANTGLPSLLGRDIINNWYMRYDPLNGRLDFSVRHADYSGRLRRA